MSLSFKIDFKTPLLMFKALHGQTVFQIFSIPREQLWKSSGRPPLVLLKSHLITEGLFAAGSPDQELNAWVG